jgi:acyl-CoA dehydrogenase
MLSFEFSKENLEWQMFVRSFVKEFVMTRTDLDTHEHFPMDLYQMAFDKGLITSMIPTEYGGGGKSLLDSILAAEECSYGDLGFTTSAFLMRLSCAPLLLFGTEEQKQKFITPLTKKLSFASFCFTEAEGSTNLGSRPASTTVRKVDGGYIIDGAKWTISNASVASLYTVFARFENEEMGMSCFVIPRDLEGVSVSKQYRKMGQRAADTAEVKFKNVFIPEESMIGRPGQGAQIALKSLRQSRIGVGAMSLGVCQRARDLALAHCHKRLSGDGKPVVYEQDVKFQFAEIDAKIEMLRAFVLKATWELENGKMGTKFSSSVKLLGGRLACEITNQCLELHGGQGYLIDGKIEKLVRDAKILQIFEGTEAVQKLLIADTAIRIKTGRSS